MAVACIYQIQKGCSIERDEFICPELFYDNDELRLWSDYFYNSGEVDITTFEELSDRFSKECFADVVKIDSIEETITFFPGFKEVYFQWKFEEFQRLATQATLEAFADSRFEYQIRNLLGASFDDFIYDQAEGYPKKIDRYFRDLELEEPVTFYCGGVVAFHY